MNIIRRKLKEIFVFIFRVFFCQLLMQCDENQRQRMLIHFVMQSNSFVCLLFLFTNWNWMCVSVWVRCKILHIKYVRHLFVFRYCNRCFQQKNKCANELSQWHDGFHILFLSREPAAEWDKNPARYFSRNAVDRLQTTNNETHKLCVCTIFA